MERRRPKLRRLKIVDLSALANQPMETIHNTRADSNRASLTSLPFDGATGHSSDTARVTSQIWRSSAATQAAGNERRGSIRSLVPMCFHHLPA